MYLRLYHGRNNPDDQLDDWGFDGPIIKDVAITWTYGSLKIHGNGTFIDLPVYEDMVVLEGKYYGDFELIENSDWKKEDRAGKLIMSFGHLEQVVNKDKANDLHTTHSQVQANDDDSIVSILDIEPISDELMRYLYGRYTYKDTKSLDEHLYSISVFEDFDWDEFQISTDANTERIEILKRCADKDCSYFRIIFW